MEQVIDRYIMAQPVMSCESWVEKASKFHSGLIAGMIFKRVAELNRVR